MGFWADFKQRNYVDPLMLYTLDAKQIEGILKGEVKCPYKNPGEVTYFVACNEGIRELRDVKMRDVQHFLKWKSFTEAFAQCPWFGEFKYSGQSKIIIPSTSEMIYFTPGRNGDGKLLTQENVHSNVWGNRHHLDGMALSQTRLLTTPVLLPDLRRMLKETFAH